MQTKFLTIILIVLLFAAAISAQTSNFTYQGQLIDNSMPASGTYQMQFFLFDALSGGSQVGSTLTNSAVTVSNGIFTVQLDFSSAPFATGTDRYLQIAVKKPADAGYTPLTPRQPITSSPYSIRTLSAASADTLSNSCSACVTNAQINSVDGAKVTGSTVTNLNASNLASGTVADARLSANVTLQGNTFNAANRLVKLDANGKFPAIDGSQITNISATPGSAVFFSVTSGSTYALGSGVGTASARSFFPSLGGATGSGVTVILTLPPANSYPSGTVLRVYLVDYITSTPTFQFQRTSGTSDLLHGFNQGTGVAGPASFATPLLSWTTDGSSNWYKGN